MDLKEWALILIPILGNGILLFIFQQFMLNRIKRSDNINLYRQETLRKGLEVFQSLYKTTLDIEKLNSTKFGTHVSVAEVINPIAEMITELKIFTDTHPLIFTETNIPANDCIQMWTCMCNILLVDRVYNDNTISGQGSREFLQKHAAMQKLIRKSMLLCEQELLK